MASLASKIGEAEQGIEPVPQARRVLGTWDMFVLWADLGISLLGHKRRQGQGRSGQKHGSFHQDGLRSHHPTPVCTGLPTAIGKGGLRHTSPPLQHDSRVNRAVVTTHR